MVRCAVLTALFMCPIAAARELPEAAGTRSAAARSWKRFFPRLREAVHRRDRRALLTMMTPGFVYSFGGDPDRAQAFTYWDQNPADGWSKLNGVLAKGVSASRWDSSISGRSGRVLTRVAPPAALREGYVQHRAYFEYGSDGKWRLAAFVAGD
jgi:hypothetical protein